MNSTTNYTGIGAPVERKEDKRFITGRGQYTDDINISGQSYAVFVRSPVAHAKINCIDVSAAEAAEGVLAVLTGKELKADGVAGLICGWTVTSKDGSEMKVGEHPALAVDKVRYVGDHVAVVVASSKHAARHAAELVDVDYEDLDPVVDLTKVREANPVHDEAPNNISFEWELGEKTPTEQAIANAAHITELELTNNRLIPNAMEPRAAIGEYNPAEDHYTLYTTSQNPHVARLVISAFVQLAPEHKLRVIAPDVGGGFGSKIFIYAEEVVCLWASKKVGRPVKWTADRSESFLADAHGRDHISTAKLALAEDGTFLGLHVKTTANLGAYLSTFASAVPTYLYGTLLSGQYNIPAIYVEVDGVYTTTAPVDAYRGAGRPEATFLLERIVEKAARELNIDPAELRKRNFIDSFPYQTPVIMNYDVGDYHASLDEGLKRIQYDDFPARRTASEANGKKRGIGFSTYIEACGIAPSAAVGSLGAGVGLWESAEVRVNPTGNVEVLTGAHSHGQGHETTFAQLVSHRFGIPIEDIEIVHGDTDKVQFGMGTYGSRSGAVGMSAITIACDKVIAKGKKIAAHLMEVPADNVDFEDGLYIGKDSNKTLGFGEVALAAYTAHGFPTDEIEPGLKESCFYDPANFTFPAGCHICEVEIDPETGVLDIVNFVAVDDFGTVINPMIVEGQVHGGLVQGIGQALLEGCTYDPDSGQLVTGSFMDYTMPRADNVPNFDVGMTITECPSNPIGMKGCGEAGAIGATPAVLNAIFAATGKRIRDLPLKNHDLA